MEKGKVIMMTAEQEADFDRLKLAIQNNHDNKERNIGELLVVLGVLNPLEALQRQRRFGYE